MWNLKPTISIAMAVDEKRSEPHLTVNKTFHPTHELVHRPVSIINGGESHWKWIVHLGYLGQRPVV